MRENVSIAEGTLRGRGGENWLADREQPHWTSSLRRPPLVTPFPGTCKEAQELTQTSSPFYLPCPVPLTAMLSLNKDFLFFCSDTLSGLKKTGGALGRRGKCSPGMMLSQVCLKRDPCLTLPIPPLQGVGSPLTSISLA